GPDEGDPPIAHRDGLRPRSRRVHGVDGAVHEDEVRRRSVASHRSSRLEVVGSVPSYASATRSRYSSLHRSIAPSGIRRMRAGASASTNSWSWLTRSIVPGHPWRASAMAVRDGGSRLFV